MSNKFLEQISVIKKDGEKELASLESNCGKKYPASSASSTLKLDSFNAKVESWSYHAEVDG